MRFYFKRFRHLILGVATCLALVGLYSGFLDAQPIQASQPAARLSSPTGSIIGSTASATLSSEFSLVKSVQSNVQSAETRLLAQGMQPGATYVALMSEDNVYPNSPKTFARGTVGAVVSGSRMIVRGSFKTLTSAPRDYATDPVNPPNTNITSAFHIHQGTPMENGPFQYALDVMLDETGRGGDAMGEYTLTSEQLQALSDGRLYVDIHTTKNRGGELRGILMPY